LYFKQSQRTEADGIDDIVCYYTQVVYPVKNGDPPGQLLHLTAVAHAHGEVFYPNWTTLGKKNDVLSILKMADLSHPGF